MGASRGTVLSGTDRSGVGEGGVPSKGEGECGHESNRTPLCLDSIGITVPSSEPAELSTLGLGGVDEIPS